MNLLSKILLSAVLLLALAVPVQAQELEGYQLPPQEIIKLVDAPATPSVYISPSGEYIILGENRGLPLLEEMAATEIRVGGIRIDPQTNGPAKTSFHTGLSIMRISDSTIRPVKGMPQEAQIRSISWSADGSHIAFLNNTSVGIELWILDVNKAEARQLSKADVNDAMGNGFSWLSDSKHIIYSAIPASRGILPARPQVASSPIIQENIGRRAATRTFQDLIRNTHDEELFDYYTQSQLVKIDLEGRKQEIAEAGVIWYFNPSPNGKYVIVNRILKPYSYIVPYSRFPQRVEVWDTEGQLVKIIAELPLADDIPQGAGAVRKGPRGITWRNDVSATLMWVEALDDGDPAREVDFRDQLFFLEAPFIEKPTAGLKLALRYSGVQWGNDQLAIVTQSWWRDRRQIVSFFDPSKPQQAAKVIFDRSSEDLYNDPGRFLSTTSVNGQSVLLFDKALKKLYLAGSGASAEGSKPFVDEFTIGSMRTKRLWQSQDPYFEYLVRLLDPDKGLAITRRESATQHPDFYLRDFRRSRISRITQLPDPSEGLKNISKQMVHYVREDGIPLSGTLYLPQGFKPGEDAPLPLILWAYPQEFKSADAAGQSSSSPNTYIRVGASSVVFYVTQGYAVLDNASFPIVGEGETEPNDSFVEQLIANAKAAIDKMVEMKVADPERVAVSGHSYGAFMTANLLSHSNLFAAGIARSGAYNRTLTPFGFQSEERNFWQASDVYHRMSPFAYADRMKTPLLLIHGAEDNNSGTFPMQSERYYDALRGNGATARLVLLPHESHGYRARESVLHMHWETLEWLEKYVKNK